MRLNSALISTFLFVSAALADPHSEEQLPPFLNRVEKSIDPTTVIESASDAYAGALWFTKQESIDFVAGTFFAPSAYSRSDEKSFTIQVGILSSGPDCFLSAGVRVTTDGMEKTKYEGFAFWYPDKDVMFSPMAFSINTGDRMGAYVHMFHGDSKNGLMALQNFNTETIWIVVFRNQPSCPNRWQADWSIGRVAPATVKVPNFRAVSFTEITVQTSGYPKIPDGRLAIMNLQEDNRNITRVDVFEDFVLIKYLSDG